MQLRILFPALLLAVACSTAGENGEPKAADPGGSTPATTPATTPADASAPFDPNNPLAYDDADCNLSTPLQPGIPGSPGHLIPSERNPNGDSELATIMRGFVHDLEAARLEVAAGRVPQAMFERHRRMRCAWPTNPRERDEGYDQRALAYLFAVRQFEAAPSQATYGAIVANCVACHQASCSGVIPFIETLQWR